jgi:hypothetical protein
LLPQQAPPALLEVEPAGADRQRDRVHVRMLGEPRLDRCEGGVAFVLLTGMSFSRLGSLNATPPISNSYRCDCVQPIFAWMTSCSRRRLIELATCLRRLDRLLGRVPRLCEVGADARAEDEGADRRL